LTDEEMALQMALSEYNEEVTNLPQQKKRRQDNSDQFEETRSSNNVKSNNISSNNNNSSNSNSNSNSSNNSISNNDFIQQKLTQKQKRSYKSGKNSFHSIDKVKHEKQKKLIKKNKGFNIYSDSEDQEEEQEKDGEQDAKTKFQFRSHLTIRFLIIIINAKPKP
jgi:hypothetical protein